MSDSTVLAVVVGAVHDDVRKLETTVTKQIAKQRQFRRHAPLCTGLLALGELVTWTSIIVRVIVIIIIIIIIIILIVIVRIIVIVIVRVIVMRCAQTCLRLRLPLCCEPCSRPSPAGNYH